MAPCIDPTGRNEEEELEVQQEVKQQQAVPARPRATVGAKAPDFEATALVDGDFKDVKLSDYDGEWTVLCFYPAAFTFV